MGGTQRIFFGDFPPLPPVPNDNTEDIDRKAILSEDFKRFVPHNVFLENVRETWLHGKHLRQLNFCQLADRIHIDIGCYCLEVHF